MTPSANIKVLRYRLICAAWGAILLTVPNKQYHNLQWDTRLSIYLK